jgi:hypothetical protein
MNLIQEVLTTPGIVTHIAKHLSNDNKDTLRSLYFLFNDNRYRYELQPFMEKVKEDKRKKTQRLYFSVGRVIEDLLFVKNRYNCCEYLMNHYVMGGLFNILQENGDLFFKQEKAIIDYYEAFPSNFEYALRKYRRNYRGISYKQKRKNINKALSITIVKTKDDLYSYPLG